MRALAAFAATLLAAGTAAAQDGPSGQAMVQTCYVCHGPEGRSAEGVPALMRGQKELVVRQIEPRRQELQRRADRLDRRLSRRIEVRKS
jgi:cytochrome c553